MKTFNIRNQPMKQGDKITWMSGGTWHGVIIGIWPVFSSVYYKTMHVVSVKAENGQVYSLSYAENYGINLAN